MIEMNFGTGMQRFTEINFSLLWSGIELRLGLLRYYSILGNLLKFSRHFSFSTIRSVQDDHHPYFLIVSRDGVF
jgi:hypothetical protein